MGTENEIPDGDDGQVNNEVETEARSMGWRPLDEFKGDPEKWVDAQEFVERGKHVLPIVLENNKRLQRDLSTRDRKIDTLQKKLDDAFTAIEKLEKHYSEANKRAVDNAKRQLREELKQAREDNDVDKEFEIQDRIADLDRASQAPEKTVTKPTTKSDEVDTEFAAWVKDNNWFDVDKKKTKEVVRIAEDLREEGSELTGREFFDECVRVWEERNAPPKGRTTSKAESPMTRTPRGNGKKSFADLPRDAQEACLADADTFVGPGKRYEKLDQWKAQYASIYFSED